MSEPSLWDDLSAFAGLLEAEWYNGNLDEKAYLRLNTDLTGLVAKHRQLTLDSAEEIARLERQLQKCEEGPWG